MIQTLKLRLVGFFFVCIAGVGWWANHERCDGCAPRRDGDAAPRPDLIEVVAKPSVVHDLCRVCCVMLRVVGPAAARVLPLCVMEGREKASSAIHKKVLKKVI